PEDLRNVASASGDAFDPMRKKLPCCHIRSWQLRTPRTRHLRQRAGQIPQRPGRHRCKSIARSSLGSPAGLRRSTLCLCRTIDLNHPTPRLLQVVTFFFLAVLFAAACHAGWKALIKLGLDPLSTATLLAVGSAAVGLILLAGLRHAGFGLLAVV